ncbi:MAG: hypothetical protein IJS47_04280 [Clostridia bacterium]|nr:hypothetical protein [Clostridia bacterium]
MNKIIIAILTLSIVIMVGGTGIVTWLFTEQYNSNGISHFLVITIDKNSPKEYVGELDNHLVYVEQLKLDETNFRSVDAKNVSIKEAIDNNLVSIADWRKYAWKIKKDGDTEVLKYENYEIAITSDECVIRLLTR